ncbi:MAG: hypothetical protein AB7O96_12925 [Pseudobdellovibrionaceae bacterium]
MSKPFAILRLYSARSLLAAFDTNPKTARGSSAVEYDALIRVLDLIEGKPEDLKVLAEVNLDPRFIEFTRLVLDTKTSFEQLEVAFNELFVKHPNFLEKAQQNLNMKIANQNNGAAMCSRVFL